MDVFTLAAKLVLDTSGFSSDLSSAESQMKGTSNRLSGAAVTIGNLASQAIQWASKAVTNFGKQTVKVGMDFDTQMSQVKALGQLQDDEFVKLRKRAMELGASTKFTAAQVGEAFSYMALAGWDTDEMLEGIDGMLNLAAASGEDLGQVSDIITDALTAFGLEAKDAGHFVDVLAAASANSNTTVSQMGQAFKYLATNAGVLNYSIDDTAIALGLLANNGIKSSQAGTSMRQIINSLIAPTDKAAAAMEQLGLYLFEDGTDKVKPLRQVLTEMRTIFNESDFDLNGRPLEEVQEALDALDAEYDQYMDEIANSETGLTSMGIIGGIYDEDDVKAWYKKSLQELTGFNELFLANLSDIGGLRGISSLIAMMKTTDEDFDQLVNAVDNSEGSAQQMAETMLDNLEGDITILNSALEGLQIVVSDDFKNALRGFVQVLTEEIGNLNEAFQANGVLGMFTNLASWVINGITDSLSNPNEEQVNQFGEAIGTFIGEVAAKLLTNIDSLVGGIITIGTSLASGLVEGLFKGLFGENTEVTKIVDALNKELGNVEVDNVKANAYLDLLQEMVDSGDDNVTKTEKWKKTVEKLEQVMPGVTAELEAQGRTLQENLNKVRQMTNEIRKQAINQAFVNTLQKQYETLAEKGVEREQYILEKEAAEKTQKNATESLISSIKTYAQEVLNLPEEYLSEDLKRSAENALKGYTVVGGEEVDFSKLGFDQLKDLLADMYEASGEQEIAGALNPDSVKQLAVAYSDAETTITTAGTKIEEINGTMGDLSSSIAITESAIDRMSGELGVTGTNIAVAGAEVVSALTGLAAGLGGAGGEEDGSRAAGLWTVPYDGYTAELHRNETVLTASQARAYKNGIGGDIDLSALSNSIVSAVQSGMANATVNSYIDGKKVTSEVNKNTYNQVAARRYVP